MDCRECEMFQDKILIKVVDEVGSINCEELSHFENGFKCTYNGVESTELNDLKLLGCCRCED